jgi:type IV pilus assembly protein PilW
MKKPNSQQGFTLIELMIAVTVGLFLIGGMLMMVQSTRNAFGNQNALAQLQDNERLVMTFMAEVVESAGYFPDPVHNVSTGVLPVTATFATAGQSVFGTYNAASPYDSVSIRYAAAVNDNVFNCKGLINTGAAIDVFINRFWINTADPNNPVLTCTVITNTIPAPGFAVALVNGVQKLAILYGVKRNPVDTGSCADTYLRADQMAAADWTAVCSIKMSVSFANPIKPASPLVITRVIAVMNAAGVNS